VRPQKGNAKATGVDRRSSSNTDKLLHTKKVGKEQSDGCSAYKDPHSTSSQATTLRDRKGNIKAAKADTPTSELKTPIHPTEQSLFQDEDTGSDMEVSDTSRNIGEQAQMIQNTQSQECACSESASRPDVGSNGTPLFASAKF